MKNKNNNFANPKFFNTKIILQKQTNTPDGAGGYESSWNNYLTMYACITDEKVLDFQSGKRASYIQVYTIFTRWNSEILAGDRIIMNDTKLSITTVSNLEQSNAIARIECRELFI